MNCAAYTAVDRAESESDATQYLAKEIFVHRGILSALPSSFLR